jgi:quercetin dioxygenase-like cupin family protein
MIENSRIRWATFGVAFIFGAALMAFHPDLAQAEQKKFGAEVLQEEEIGTLDGEQKMRIVMFTMQPGAEVPEHKHGGPGLRYVLEGAITIAWKDGPEKTFEAGETYFEGPGANHPAGTFSARNPTDQMTRVLIIETLPK